MITDIVKQALDRVSTALVPIGQEEKGASRVFEEDRLSAMQDIFKYHMAQDIDKLQYMEQFKEVPWVYACTDAISKAISSLPTKVYKIKAKGNNTRAGVSSLITRSGGIQKLENRLLRKGNEKRLEVKIENIEEVVDGMLIDVLEQPNNNITGVEFWEAVSQHLELRGNSFWENVGEKEGVPISINNPPVDIYLLNPNYMVILPDPKEYIKGYVYSINGKDIKFERDEIHHMRFHDPNNQFYGHAAISSLVKTLLNYKYAIAYNTKFFENSARPDGVLKATDNENPLSTPQRERIIAGWGEKYGGIGKSHKVALLEGGVEYQQIGVSQRDAEFIQSLKMNREEILAAMDVPPVVVGLETANYAVSRTEWRKFWRNNIKPKAVRRDASLNVHFVPFYGEEFYVETDFEDVDVLRDDRSEEHKRYFDMGCMSQNEIRSDINRPAAKNGDTLYVNPNLMPVAEVATSKKEVEDEGETDEYI